MNLSLVARGCFVLLTAWTSALSAEIETSDLEWEAACGGSNIEVTRVDGIVTLIEAFAEHSTASRTWTCHHVGEKMVSASSRHDTVETAPFSRSAT
jgi:hypothetical protein